MTNVAEMEKFGQRVYNSLETEEGTLDLRLTLLEILDDHEYAALTRLTGLEDGHPWGIADMVMELGMSDIALLQVLKGALSKLRHHDIIAAF